MRLVWTNREENTVTDEAVRLCRHDPLVTIGDALYMAQKLLPESRRKAELTPFYKRALLERTQAKIDKAQGTPKQFPLSLDPQHQQRPLEEPAPVEKPKSSLELAVPLLRELGGAIGEAMARELKVPLAATLREVVINALAGVVKMNGNPSAAAPAPTPEPQPEKPQSRLPAKFEKHKVCVIGFPEPYRSNLAGLYPNLDMRFLSGDAPGHVAKATANACEHTFVMIKGSAHRVEQLLPSGRYSRVNGSQTDLKRLLSARFPRSTSMEPSRSAARN